MANNFSGDSNCVALWKFDNNADDGKGGNDLTEVGSPSYDSGDKKEGTHCIDLEYDSNQHCKIADGDLDAGFPGKSGTSEQSFSICCWLKSESGGGIVSKWGTGAFSFACVLSGGGYLYFYIGYNSGSSQSSIIFETQLSTGKWYHIGFVYDASDNGMKLRVWDDDAGELLDDNKEGTAGGDMSPDTAPLEIGRHYQNNNNCFDGKIDEVVFFDKVLSDDDIDAIRAGTYGAAVTEKQSADTGSGAEGMPIASVILTGTESGTGVDAVESLQTPQAKTSSETGSGSDALVQAQAILEGAENGSGVDAVESLQTPQAKTSADVGSGTEGMPTQSAVLEGSESGSGIEALIARLLAGEESGAAVEASSLNTGGGIEELFADESGEGADRLVARIEMPTKGGGMKLWT